MVVLISINGYWLQGAHMFDTCAEGTELGIQVLIAAFDMFYAIGL